MKMWIAALASLALKRRLLSFAAPVRSLWRRRGRHAPLQARSALLLGCRLGIFLILLSVLPTTTQAAVNQNTTLNPPNLNSGLVGHWTFDGKDMLTNVRDSSGQGNTSLLIAAATSSQVVAGVLGQALKFNGTTQYASSTKSISGIQSVGFWAQTSSTTAQGLINLTGTTVYISTDANKALSGTGFTSPIYYIDGAASTTPGLYNANWHYVVVTGTAAITGSLFQIGRANTQYFAGTFDDARIYSRALSAAEVKQLYNGGTGTHQNTTLNPPNLNSGLVGHWTFDGKDMLKNVADSSGQGNTGYLVAAATSSQQVAGPLGQALKFNGSTQYVNEPTSISSIQSVGFWAQTASTTAQGLINLTGSTVYISTNANKVISGTGFTSPTYYVDGSASTTPGLYNANWHYVVVIGTAAITGSQLEIARANTQYFAGSIDDPRIYNRALSAAEVKQLYNLGH